MLRSNGPQRARCLLGGLLLISLAAHAQNEQADTYKSEYMKRLKGYQTIQPHGETPFGERIDLATGQVTFTQTDIVLEGTGPTIRVSRSRSATGWDQSTVDAPPAQVLGEWTLNLPRITTLVARPRDIVGDRPPGENWRMSFAIDAASRKRCTNFGDVYVGQGGIPLDDWWHGYEIVMDDGGSQPLMLRDPKYTLKPTTGTYPIVTLSDMQISCLSTTSNGEAGEAFLAIGPDGTKYWFDHLVGTNYGRVRMQNPEQPGVASAEVPAASPPPDAEPETMSLAGTQPLIQDRMSAAMFVSKIQDRFGNTLVYHYDPANPLRLLSIVASDGRKVSFAWNGLQITSATAQPDTPADARTWTYGYGTDGRLSSVTLPDASRWTFDLGLTGEGSLPDMFANSCTRRYNANAPATDATVSTVTAPSGLIGTFTMRHRWHARSYANTACINQLYESIPPLYENLSLVQRTLSGPGLSTQTWTYAYSPATASAKYDACAATQSCVDRAWVDVTEPGGTRTRYTHSTRDGVMEGKLLTTEIFEVGGALLRTESISYPALASLPFQARLGEVFGRMRSNVEKMQTRYPMTQRVITQQGRRFYWYVHGSCGPSSNALCLDAFGRPTKTVKLSQPAP